MLERAETGVWVRQAERTGAAILFDRVTRRFGAVTAVSDLTLTVERGEFITFLGPSGSGKTTCLMLLAGFETPDVGELYIDRVPISRMPPHRRDIGVVFQSYALFPHMTVAENIGFPLRQRGVGRKELHSRVNETLELVQMVGLGGRYPRQLSGGQQQRVAIARAVIFRPRVLLMDEPLSALDKKLREDMQFEIKELHRRLGITFVYVTHDQHEALVMSDRIAVMQQGRIEQLGTPGDVYDRPANRFVASFIGESNFLDGDIRHESGWAVLNRAGAVIRGVGTHAGSSLMVRPEKIGVGIERGEATASNTVSATIQDVAFAGDIRRYVLRLADGTTMTAKEQHRSGIPDFEPGATVQLTWAVADTLVV